jgi:hypothetical protein
VLPLRDIPGIKPTICIKPTLNASKYEILDNPSLFLWKFVKNNMIEVIKKKKGRYEILVRFFSIKEFRNSAANPVIKVDIIKHKNSLKLL